ncbi:hypothetical protein DNTS_016462, partial [Danionella cerebrum]
MRTSLSDQVSGEGREFVGYHSSSQSCSTTDTIILSLKPESRALRGERFGSLTSCRSYSATYNILHKDMIFQLYAMSPILIQALLTAVIPATLKVPLAQGLVNPCAPQDRDRIIDQWQVDPMRDWTTEAINRTCVHCTLSLRRCLKGGVIDYQCARYADVVIEKLFEQSKDKASRLEIHQGSLITEFCDSEISAVSTLIREIGTLMPALGLFEYHNIRVYDEEATDLLAYWNDTYKFISRAKKAGAKCLVHCKMGVSRSASTVIAYAMKEYGWDLEQAFEYVKDRRAVTKPNPSFMRQLEEYQGILMASKQRHNKLWRSHSDSDLSERLEPLCKSTAAQSLGRSSSRNQTFGQTSPSIQELLQTLSPSPVNPNRANTHIHNGLGSPENTPHEPIESPSLPRPRAATVVPEARLEITSVTVAETVSLSRPHPPASVLQPPSSPKLLLDAKPKHSPCEPTEVPSLVPLEKWPSSMNNSSRTPCTATSEPSGLQDLSKQVPITETDCVGLIHSSDEDQDPSATLQRTNLLNSPPSTLSTDRIDFFSAREKFQGLSQEIRGTEQGVQQAPRDKSPSIETKRLLPDETDKEDEQNKRESHKKQEVDEVAYQAVHITLKEEYDETDGNGRNRSSQQVTAKQKNIMKADQRSRANMV